MALFPDIFQCLIIKRMQKPQRRFFHAPEPQGTARASIAIGERVQGLIINVLVPRRPIAVQDSLKVVFNQIYTVSLQDGALNSFSI